jgi:outer membrane protein OmpA-like peptidoglycan-associated protein
MFMNRKTLCAALIGMMLAGNALAQNAGHYEVKLKDGRQLELSAEELENLKNEKGTLKSYNFIEVQGGVQLTSTDAKMTDLITPTAAFSVGRYFTPVVGARLHVNAWETKSGFNDLGFYKWNYFTTNADVMLNLTNMFSKDKSGSHPLNVILLGGIGLTNSWGNEEANAMAAANNNLNMPLVWDDNRLSHNIRAGLRLETNVTKPFGVSLEVNANSLDDRFNSKMNDADDWQFTAMLGLSFRFGHKSNKPVIVSETYIAPPAPKVEPKKEPKYITVTREIKKQVPVTLHEEAFFNIRKSDPAAAMPKIQEVAKFLNDYANAKVTVVGYADKGTGNAKLNMKYSKQRAENYKEELINKYGCDGARITVDAKGDTVQPFAENDKNRCVIIDGTATKTVTETITEKVLESEAAAK